MAEFCSDTVKFEAMRMWCEGQSISGIADYLGVGHGTVKGWKTRHEPTDWEVMREEAERAALQDVQRKIAASRAVMLENHCLDLEKMRQAWLNSMTEDVCELDHRGRPVRDADGKPVVIGRVPKKYSPKDLKDMTSAYRDIQVAQRLAHGVPNDYVPQAPTRPPEDARAQLEAAGIGDDAMEAIGEMIANHLTVTIRADDDDEPDNEETDNEVRDGLADDDD